MIFHEFPKNFQNSFSKELSWQDASDFVWLFLKNFQNTFLTLLHLLVSKGHKYLSKPSTKTLPFCYYYYWKVPEHHQLSTPLAFALHTSGKVR